MNNSAKPNIEIIEEILCRFIINLPRKELEANRIFFHIQEAHWFYLDFILTNKEQTTSRYPRQPYVNLRSFAQILLDRSPIKICDPRDYDHFYIEFRDYQSKIPVYGAIILNQCLDKVLLVMNWDKTSYSFPKGKINQNENEIDCAAREVWEEIGFTITNKISENVLLPIF